ncbi:MAG: 2Fe-2S iron-sulfur cluster binding domain-containing protein [Burkholderiales bacterium]|nr:2Fe-2S iron-sulfur cluster binding domain-containing protein [Burkholderiales bacterium]
MSRVELVDGKAFQVPPGVTLLDAAAHAGLSLAHSCRTGRCGACKAQCSQPGRHLQGEDCLSTAERAAGWLLSCTDTVDADARLELEDQAELARLRTLTLPCRVAQLERPAPDLLVLRLRLPSQHGLRWLPGQYLELIAPGGLRRAYSIANANPAQGVELHIRRVAGGAMSDWLFSQLQVGGLMHLRGPRGSFHLGEASGQRLVWLATGTGIAPFKAMLEALASQPQTHRPAHVTLLWGNRQSSDLYVQPAPQPWLHFVPVCSRDPAWTGAHGHVQQHAPAQADRVFACGNPAMIESARALYLSHGLPPRHFHADAFVAST